MVGLSQAFAAAVITLFEIEAGPSTGQRRCTWWGRAWNHARVALGSEPSFNAGRNLVTFRRLKTAHEICDQ